MSNIPSFINLMHEIGMLAQTPRSGFAFLGSGSQSVAEHSFRMAWIGFILVELSPTTLDRERLLLLCLVHDLAEARTGDLNYVNKRYVQSDEEKAAQDIRSAYPCGPFLYEAMKEYRDGKTPEAQLAHDADQLELLLVLKGEMELGNARAERWYSNTRKRLKSSLAQQIADAILQIPADSWWLSSAINGNRSE